MPRPLFVTDLDGTLLEADGSLPPQAGRLRRLLRDRGFQFAVATSRSPQNVKALFPGDELWAVCSDGAATVSLSRSGFEVVGERLLSPHQSLEALAVLLAACEGRPALPLVFTGRARGFEVLVRREPGETVPDLIAAAESLVADGREVVPAATEMLLQAVRQGTIRAVSCFGPEPEIAAVAASVSSRIPAGTVAFSYAETRIADPLAWLDLHRDDVEKAVAVTELAAVSGAGAVVMLGNGANDARLLGSADWSACPSDGVDAAKRAADFVARGKGGGEFIAEVCDVIEAGMLVKGEV